MQAGLAPELRALELALQVRREVAVKPWEAMCVYDAATVLDVEVRFVDLPSAEGVYLKGPPARILLSSHRPSGRTSYNGAHELGHHVFGHGSQVDELLAGRRGHGTRPREEVLADLFAGFFLMPKTAVSTGFNRRGTTPVSCTPSDVIVIAGWLGVGYETLITHTTRSLRLMPEIHAKRLMRTQPRLARAALAGFESDGDVFVVSPLWMARTVDLRVGDFALLPTGSTFKGTNVCHVAASSSSTVASSVVYRACAPGTGHFMGPQESWTLEVRTTKQHYTGLAQYRHLEEVDDEHADHS